MEPRFISLTKDSVFKTLYLKKNKDVFKFYERVIEYISKLKLSDYELTMNELSLENYESIFNKLDILLISKDKKRKLNIEMNSQYSLASINKNNTYVMKIAGDFYAGKKPYKEEINCAQININAYTNKTNPGIDISHSYFYDPINKIVRMNVDVYDVYLPVYKELCYNNQEDIYKDLAMFMCKSYEEMETLAKDNKERTKVMEELKKLGSDKNFVGYYDIEEYEEALKEEKEEIGRAEGIAIGLKKGIAQGIEQGIEQKEKEAAINLHLNGASDELIMKSLNITKEKLEEYLNVLNTTEEA